MAVCLLCLCIVLSSVGRGLSDGLITRPGESYRVSKCMCDHRYPERGPMFQMGTTGKWMTYSWTVLLQLWACSTRNFLIKLVISSLTVSCQNSCVDAVLKFTLIIDSPS
jgi:hypothetical protein